MTNHITKEGTTITAELEDDKIEDKSALLTFFRNDEKIPLSKLSKYYLNENLNF
jgi:hypothetical protein